MAEALRKGQKVRISDEMPHQWAGKTARIVRPLYEVGEGESDIWAYRVERKGKQYPVEVEYIQTLDSLAEALKRAEASAQQGRDFANRANRKIIDDQIRLIEAGLIPVEALRVRIVDAPLVKASVPTGDDSMTGAHLHISTPWRLEMEMQLIGVPTGKDSTDEILTAIAKAVRGQ